MSVEIRNKRDNSRLSTLESSSVRLTRLTLYTCLVYYSRRGSPSESGEVVETGRNRLRRSVLLKNLKRYLFLFGSSA